MTDKKVVQTGIFKRKVSVFFGFNKIFLLSKVVMQMDSCM